MTETNKILIALSLEFNGDWDAIYQRLLDKEKPSEEYLEMAENYENNTITIISENYPAKLKQIRKPPFVLFYKGNINLLETDKKAFSIEGIREPSETTKKQVEKVASFLSAKDNILISGMALGVQTIALENFTSKNVIGVLNGGINNIYPQQNKALFNEIATNGLLLSEYPNETPVSQEKCLNRNRIIAGLCDYLIQAEVKTNVSVATNCVMSGKDIFAIPDPFNADNKANALIEQGATPLVRLEQLEA